MKRRARSGPPGRYPPPRRRLRRLLIVAVIGLLLIGVSTSAFIGTRCYGKAAGTESRALGDIPAGLDGYVRSEAFTYLTLPEWFIVYSTEEYARFVQKRSPKDFPYLGSVGQYWGYYDSMCQATRGKYPFETGYHMMLGVIGVSFTIENVVKAAYENTIGRLSEWISSRDTAEDRFAAKVATEYAMFIHAVPWYEFSFTTQLHRLWTQVPLGGPNVFRKWERRLALSAEYSRQGNLWRAARPGNPQRVCARRFKGVCESGSGDRRDLPRLARREDSPDAGHLCRAPAALRSFHPDHAAAPRDGRAVCRRSGQRPILVTALTSSALNERALKTGAIVATRPILTEPGRKRIAMRVPVAQLHRAVPELRNAGATIEHLYDY